MTREYRRSERQLERALRSIPLGSQTFSKSPTHLPHGASPLFAERGEGCRLWDIDGNEYLDFVNGLAAVLLGYADPDVDAAIAKQLRSGVTFSLPHALESEVAERLIEQVPCAERVRFGKNGSDATSAAIRVARAATGRDRVALCGYHGWHDWTIGTTSRDLGVPDATQALSSVFSYNDVDSLTALFDRHPGEYAAVILEPVADQLPVAGFLEGVAKATRTHGALLVFDETVTGLRLAPGGAQETFGVSPDLATFGKGLANGLPLSALVGRAEWMALLDRVFFSTTFGGETLALAAARALLDKASEVGLAKHLEARGARLIRGFSALREAGRFGEWLDLSGHPSWTFLHFREAGPYSSWEVKTLFQQECAERGVLGLGTHNLSYAHGDTEIDTLLEVYREVGTIITRAVETETLRVHLRGATLGPLFAVRASPRESS